MASSPTRTLPAPSSNIHDAEATAVLRRAVDGERNALPCVTDSIFEPRVHEVIGAYRIVRTVGAGGMGVVYEAVDLRLKRRAAIKMIRGEVGVSRDAVRRFQTEAEAVAQTHHPNIVQIYDVGWHEGQPYVALEFLPGGSLHAKVAGKPQPPQEAATLVRTLAEAMQHAHDKGVIHRDLKPANILFTADGTPKVTDFGAARLTQEGADSNIPGLGLTKVGEVIGTPQYMAPEQARGTATGATSAIDVYALGALLYHMLTGRPPHDGPDSFDVLNSVVQNDPLTPRRLVANVPRDLETVCLKALSKHPAHRYASAAAMAEDLGRFLAGESILARPDPVPVRLLKKARRRPLIAGLVAGIVLVAFAGLTGIVWQWQGALEAEQRALDLKNEADGARSEAEKQATIAANAAHRAVAESRDKELNLFRSRVSEIALLLEGGDAEKARSLLLDMSTPRDDAPDPRHWEWHYLNRLGSNFLWRSPPLEGLPGDFNWPHIFAVSPDAKRIAISAGDPYSKPGFDELTPATLFLADAASGKIERVWRNYLPQAAEQLIWLDPTTLAASTRLKGMKVLRVPDGQVLRELGEPTGPFQHHMSHPCRLSPDGRTAYRATSSRVVALYDTRSGDVKRTIEFDDRILGIPFAEQAGDDWKFVVCTTRGTRVIDPRTGDTVLAFPNDVMQIATFDHSGRYLLAMLRTLPDETPTRIECWDLAERRLLWQRARPHPSEICRWQFSPDGDKLAEVYNSNVALKLFDTHTGQLECEFRGHTNRIMNFQFSPDGRQIATASNDGSVRVWSLAEGCEIARFRGHSTGARVVHYDPNGWRLYSGGMDGYAIAWDLTRERTDGTRLPFIQPMNSSHGGAFAGGLWCGADGLARFLDTTFGRLLVFDPATYSPIKIVNCEGLGYRAEKTATDYALSADSRFLFGTASSADWSPRLWNAATGEVVRKFPGVRGRVTAAALNADGSRAAATASEFLADNTIRREFFLWDTATGEVLLHEKLPTYTYTSLVFHPKEHQLYMAVGSFRSSESGFHVLDLNTLERTKLPRKHKTFIRHMAFSPDGCRLAAIDHQPDEMKVLCFETANPAKEWVIKNAGPTTGLAFSPDGRRLASVRFDDSFRLYDAESGHETLFKPVPSNRLGDYAFPARVAFSPDGRSIIMNHSGSQLSVWRTDDGSKTSVRRGADRRTEAEHAAYAFHIRAANELADKPDRVGFQFHIRWLDRLAPPNDYLRAEYDTLRIIADYAK